jgi:hypothetical protein
MTIKKSAGDENLLYNLLSPGNGLGLLVQGGAGEGGRCGPFSFRLSGKDGIIREKGRSQAPNRKGRKAETVSVQYGRIEK